MSPAAALCRMVGGAVLALLLTASVVQAQEQLPVGAFRWAIRPIGGEEVRLERFRGEVLFVNLWASWCRPCVAELRSIERLRESLGGVDGVRFVMVSPEGERSVLKFLRRNAYDLPFYTEAQRMPPAFGLRALPTTFIVDRRGRLVLVHRGAADWDTDRVRELITGLARR